jgi:hypothetical protein
MPCYHPLKGYRALKKNPSGKRSIVFNPKYGFLDQPVEVPCGQCIGCRLERSRQWAMRCLFEAQMHEDNCFITLTFAPEHLPKDSSLDITYFQKFMKRLRKHAYPLKIKYYHCGEYGEENGRPHFHACIFGYDFSDKILYSSRGGFDHYCSETLGKLWKYGHHDIGDVTFESAAYVARYIMKKRLGKDATEHYTEFDKTTGEIFRERLPEYTSMSNGIGSDWFAEFQDDVYPKDFVTVRGIKMKPPKYFDNKFEITAPDEYAQLKARRKKLSEKNAENCTYERLSVREKLQSIKAKKLIRSYENDY